MRTKRDEFLDRLYSEFVPAFCDARSHAFRPEAFDNRNCAALNEYDAAWFLRGLEKGYVSSSGGFFVSELSKAKEQIFWSGSRSGSPRRFTLWLEPIITIGALARLVDEYRWPARQVGLQSVAPWPFDLVGYASDRQTELLVCEVKKSAREVRQVVDAMATFAAIPRLGEEPQDRLRNAYRKVAGIRRSWPEVFWALGPDGEGSVFRIVRSSSEDAFSLAQVGSEGLLFSA